MFANSDAGLYYVNFGFVIKIFLSTNKMNIYEENINDLVPDIKSSFSLYIRYYIMLSKVSLYIK